LISLSPVLSQPRPRNSGARTRAMRSILPEGRWPESTPP
jgi:hypothetical protein